MLDSDDVATGNDQSRGVEVPQVVQGELVDADLPANPAPLIARAVAVVDVAAQREQVAVLAVRRNVLDVPGQQRDEIAREVDDEGGFVLRGRLGSALLTCPWDLPIDDQRASQEVDVAELQASSLPSRNPAKAQTARKARNSAGATASACATCSGVGIRILVSALGTFGGVSATVGWTRVLPLLRAR